MIAVVEANRKLVVIELATQNAIYSAENVVSVHFNSEVNDMLCFASEDSVTVVSGEEISKLLIISAKNFRHRSIQRCQTPRSL